MTCCKMYCFTLDRPSAVSVTLASRVSLTSMGLLDCIELRREVLLEAGEVEPRVAVAAEREPLLVFEFKRVEWVESNVVMFTEGSMGVGGISVTLMGNEPRDRVSGPKEEAKMEPERVVVGDIVNSGSCSFMSTGASGAKGATGATGATGGEECSDWSMVCWMEFGGEGMWRRIKGLDVEEVMDEDKAKLPLYFFWVVSGWDDSFASSVHFWTRENKDRERTLTTFHFLTSLSILHHSPCAHTRRYTNTPTVHWTDSAHKTLSLLLVSPLLVSPLLVHPDACVNPIQRED